MVEVIVVALMITVHYHIIGGLVAIWWLTNDIHDDAFWAVVRRESKRPRFGWRATKFSLWLIARWPKLFVLLVASAIHDWRGRR